MLNKPVPLVLDLDGTLIRTDTFHEMMVQLLIHKPLLLLMLPYWMLKGRAYAKAALVRETILFPHTLPYNTGLLEFAHSEVKKGRPLFLATGSDQKIAQEIADHCGIFQGVMGSDGKTNLTGPHKKEALIKQFGDQGFDYAGDSEIDLHVWRASRQAIVVHPKFGVLKKALELKGHQNTLVFPRVKKRWLALILASRPLFWPLNLLAPTLSLSLGLCLLSSGLFVLNDLMMLNKERQESCRKSVFAEGHLHLITGFLVAPCLIVISLFFTSLWIALLYSPLILVLDRFTRPLSQKVRWAILSTFQVFVFLFLKVLIQNGL